MSASMPFGVQTLITIYDDIICITVGATGHIFGSENVRKSMIRFSLLAVCVLFSCSPPSLCPECAYLGVLNQPYNNKGHLHNERVNF